ncbi:MsnO8 family LLM class oxidoreductase [Mycoplasmopsis mucosicanis]|uniref:MsnO8 family LLM class oxidoreductase n=1 Tax=Mycoplasmopsis mucosicanis TaxID=458208 RepID=A0A507SJD1_9BACT|nr:MsnO8 family LLM class oxidoreductase [Mycoplasmopsis mucosicanis]TQC51331.1 MsnO8 family LLM class oxidoreductase [Mycoplasmopsis mucosicanis]
MKISVLEHGLYSKFSSPSQCYKELAELCEFAEKLNFYSYWISEHHAIDSLIISYPLLLLDYLASKSTKIKIGCGGIMLCDYQSFSIAEQINTLNLLQPNRFIFGFGYNPGTQKVAKLLNSNANVENFQQKLLEVNEFVNSNKANELKVNPVCEQKITPTLLLTSIKSAIFAAKNKFKMNYGWFLNPFKSNAKQVIDAYIQTYTQTWGKKPEDVAISINVVSGIDSKQVQKNLKTLLLYRIYLEKGRTFNSFPLYEDFTHEDFELLINLEEIMKENWVFCLNNIEDVAKINNLCKDLNVNHLMILPTMSNISDRKKALEYIANFYNNMNKKCLYSSIKVR